MAMYLDSIVLMIYYNILLITSEINMSAKKQKKRNPPRLFAIIDIPTTASLLAVSTATIYRWMDDGRLAYVTLPSGVRRITMLEISRITRIPEEILVRFLQNASNEY